jgi:hypothetical protein
MLDEKGKPCADFFFDNQYVTVEDKGDLVVYCLGRSVFKVTVKDQSVKIIRCGQGYVQEGS